MGDHYSRVMTALEIENYKQKNTMCIEYESLMPNENLTTTQFLFWVEKSEEGSGGWKGAADHITMSLDGPQKHMITE